MKYFENLKEAIFAAREAATNDPNNNAHCITLKSDGRIFLSGGCGENVSFSVFAADNVNDFTCHLVISENCTFQKDFDFRVLEFCCKFNIPISNREWKTVLGRIA